jgi:hypothetical protein
MKQLLARAKKINQQTLGSSLINFGMLSGVATLTAALVSCGSGGGGTVTSANTTPTFTGLSVPGIVASSVARTFTILGTNLTSDMLVSIVNSSGVAVGTVNSSAVTATQITMNVTIASAPADRYVNVRIRTAADATIGESVLGVAASSVSSTAIDNIFGGSANKCNGCHTTMNPAGGLNLVDLSSGNATTGVIGAASHFCAGRLRIKPGDPRRSSSVLIDTLYTNACGGVSRMPFGGAALTQPEIQEIIEWVAGGAN